MQLRTIALVFSLVGLFYSGFASALGLGEITLKSQFNQPLNAEIKLLKVRDLSKDEIFTALASRKDFKRAGVDRLFLLSSLDFEVDIKNPANPLIRVTSSKPITEPYLNFLVEVQWPSGRLLREYTLLLDLPVFNDSQASTPVRAPRASGAVASPVQVAPAPRVNKPNPVDSASPNVQASPTEPARRVAQPSNIAVDDYTVKSGDTLWEIAASTGEGSSISVHQRMIAIQQANPNAFIKGNINRLRNGRVLRIPSDKEVANVSYQQALGAVREQNQEWSGDSQAAQKAVLTSAAPTVERAQTATQAEGRLTLGSANSDQPGAKGSGANGTGESLQNDLAIAGDELARSARQNEDLKAKVSELQAQIETLESLVSVTNDQLKALELTSKTADDTSAFSEPLVNDSDVSSDQDSQEEASPAASPTPVTEAPIQVAASESVAPLKVPSLVDTIISFITSNLLVIGGALLALLAAIFVLLRMKNKSEDELSELELDDEDESLFTVESDELDIVEDNVEASLEVENTFSMDEDLDDSVQAQTEDVVAEADIYVSLGQEDKAIELLQKEIQQNPDNAEARLSLLKIYAESQDASSFDEQYAQLLPLGNIYANDQAMALRKAIENAEPFDTDQYSLKDDDLGFLDDIEDVNDLDLDLDLDLDAAAVAVAADTSNIAFSEADSELDLSDISLDLSDLSDDSVDVKNDAVLSEPTDTDFSLDFESLEEDLSVDLEDEVSASAALAETIDLDDLNDIEFSLDLDDVAEIKPDELSVNAEKTPEDLPLEEDLEDIAFDLDLDDNLSLNDENKSLDDLGDISLDDGLENNLSIDLGDIELDDDINDLDFDIPAEDGVDLSLSIDSDLDTEFLDLDIADDLDTEVLDLDIAEDLDTESLDLDIADDLDTEVLDLDIADDLDAIDDIDTKAAELDTDDSLDLDSLPSMDIDMASLDQEIDAMTADIDNIVEEDLTIEPAEPVEVLDLDEGEELELSGDEDQDASEELELDGAKETPIASILDITDASDDTTISQDNDLDFLEESDEVSTKLDLAKAYMDMGDREGAEDILDEVMDEGNDQQKSDAKALMEKL